MINNDCVVAGASLTLFQAYKSHELFLSKVAQEYSKRVCRAVAVAAKFADGVSPLIKPV